MRLAVFLFYILISAKRARFQHTFLKFNELKSAPSVHKEWRVARVQNYSNAFGA